MASIENRSRFVVTVPSQEKLTQHFAYTREKQLKAYIHQLKQQGHKPSLTRENDNYAIRIREVGHVKQCLYASSEQEAVDVKNRIEQERRSSLFVDYAKGRQVTFGDLLVRYLREISPRHKGFEVEGYIVNAILADAGIPRVDMAQAFKEHKNPHPSLAGKRFPKPSGRVMRTASLTTCFVRKPFADVMPDDFNDYTDERCQSVAASTVDREIDIFSAVCNMAINTWRIPVAKSPMDGIQRPRYFNERDRRLKSGEEERLLNAAYDEDAQKSIDISLRALMNSEHMTAEAASSNSRGKRIRREMRELHMAEAEESNDHVPWMETFIQFQLMTGARRSESLSLTWDNICFEDQTAFIPESKNGRPRKLALRSDLLVLLRQLPRDSASVFPFTIDALRKSWARVCKAAGLVGNDELHVHDLRHESISRVADAGGKLQGGFSLVDLQTFSGHRDTRMLLRYTHLCIPSLARRLDTAFKDATQTVVHRGQRRLKKGAALTMKDLTDIELFESAPACVEQRKLTEKHPSNVIPFPVRRVA